MLNPIPDVATARGLAYLLRHQELWPGGFRWNYSSCEDCGMALLFHAIGRELPHTTEDCVNETAAILGLGGWTAWNIFAMLAVEPVKLEEFVRTGRPVGTYRRRLVTPEMVAQELEAASC